MAGIGKLLEVGCANGYIAYLFSSMGFDTSVVDAYHDEKRDEMFRTVASQRSGRPHDAEPLDARECLPAAERSIRVVGHARTPDFLRDVKLDQGKVIDRGDIHDHEYPAWIVRDVGTTTHMTFGEDL